MGFNYLVDITDNSSNWDWGAFESRQIFTYLVRPDFVELDTFKVGMLFKTIAVMKTMRIVVEPEGFDRTMGLLFRAKKERTLHNADILLQRDDITFDALHLFDVRVENVVPVVYDDESLLSDGAYIATFKVGGVFPFFAKPEEMGLMYTVVLFRRKSDSLNSSWTGTRDELGGFKTNGISVPPETPALATLKNEGEVARLFNSIEAGKQLDIFVGNAPGSKDRQNVTHLFLEAVGTRGLYDIVIVLAREDPKPRERIAQLTLLNVQVKSFRAVEDGAYVASLKVTGGTSVVKY